jgi:hypothetical protein
MVSITRPERVWTAVVAAAATLRSITANDVSFANKCAFPIALHNLADPEPRAATAIPTGAVWTVTNATGYNYYRHGDSAEATGTLSRLRLICMVSVASLAPSCVQSSRCASTRRAEAATT